MCTIAVLWRCHPAAPLVVAQCRDELLARPALDVSRWHTPQGTAIVSGRDLVAGGTWFGVGPHVVCALTNRHDDRGPRRGRRSRGELVVEVLQQPDAAAVARLLAGQNGADYGPFSLLACDGRELIATDNVEHPDARSGLAVTHVPPGVHVLGNRDLDNPADPVVRTVGAAVGSLLDSDEQSLVASLRALLGRHGEGWPCVHRSVALPGTAPPAEVNYGTRSAGVLVWRPRSPVLWTHASAPHDAEGWQDSSNMLSATTA